MGEGELPILSWESVDHRVPLPPDLRRALECEESVLRWSRSKRAAVLAAHPNDANVIVHVALHLEEWVYAGREKGKFGTWRVLFRVNAIWYSATIARDQDGSLNLVTVFGSTKRSFLRNRLQGMEGIVER